MRASSLFASVYVDEDINSQLASALRDRDFRAVAAREIGHTSMADANHLAYAVEQQMMNSVCFLSGSR